MYREEKNNMAERMGGQGHTKGLSIIPRLASSEAINSLGEIF
jgi:hypothetical protein